MKDAQINLRVLFQCAAGCLIVCALLMLLVKPLRESRSDGAAA
jgi:hypothetical protein